MAPGPPILVHGVQQALAVGDCAVFIGAGAGKVHYIFFTVSYIMFAAFCDV